MKRCSFFCAGWWPFILLPLLVLLPLLFFNWHPIEEKVALNTNNALKAAGFDWADVETFNRGRDVLLTGTAPNKEAVNDALAVARAAEGVRVAEFHNAKNNIAAPAPPILNASANDGVVKLTGTLASQGAVDQVVSDAQSVYGANNVISELNVGANTAQTVNLGQLFALFSKQGLTDNYDAQLSQNQLTLNGMVASEDIKTLIGQKAATVFKGTIRNQLSTALPPPVPEEELAPPQVAQDVCQDLLKELLTSEKINFQTGKAAIDQSSFSLLDKIGATAKRCPDARFEVAGHTDSVGSLDLNMNLSRARAQSVIDYIINLGLSTDQFSAAGYGPNQPIADNATAQGRAANRRIEFTLKN